MTNLKLNILNENHKNLKKICSYKIDSKNKIIVKYYKLILKNQKFVHFVKEIMNIFIFMVIIQNV